MTAQPARQHRMTPEEYFAWEERQELRHEYYHGEVYAMAGGTAGHSLLTTNCIVAVANALGDECAVYSSDLRIQLTEGLHYAYPDLSVVCGAPCFLTEGETTLLNPTALVEVLSPSTEQYDRGDKFRFYRQIESLRAYVLVAQGRRSIEVFQREGDGEAARWVLTESSGETIELASLGVTLALDDVYRGVSAEPD